MRVWVDGQCLQTASRFRGIGRYVEELLRALAAKDDVELLISFSSSMMRQALDAKERVAPYIPAENVFIWTNPVNEGEAHTGFDEKRQLAQYSLAHHVNCLAPDVILNGSPFEGSFDSSCPILPGFGCDIPMVSIFHDAIPNRYPEQYLKDKRVHEYYYNRLKYYQDFDRNLANSQFSADELSELYPGIEVKSISAGLGAEFTSLIETVEAGKMKARYGDYLLYVGGVDWRKNVPLIFDAVKRLPSKQRRAVKLIMVGEHSEHILDSMMNQWRNHGLPLENLFSVSHVSEADLVAFYKDAMMLIQPSLMEGFGLTVLEAMACGTPVAAGNAGAVPEVIGYDDVLFDPENPNELMTIIRPIVEGRADTAKLTERGLERAKLFSWDKSAEIASAELHLAASKKSMRAPDVAKSRKAISTRVKRLGLDKGEISKVLASTEPQKAGQPHLLYDATQTSLFDSGTGIQRVVRNVAVELMNLPKGPDDMPWEMVFCGKQDDGFYKIGVSENNRVLPARKTDENRIFPGLGDHIFFLDSSWIEQSLQRHRLMGYRARGVDITIGLHDLVPLKASAFCDAGMPPGFASWLDGALRYATGFVCVSKATADDLIRTLEGMEFPREMKVGYFHNGANFNLQVDADAASTKKDQTPHFLMVGTLEPRKGYSVAIRAFSKLWKEGVNVKLTIVGKEGWNIRHLLDEIEEHEEFDKRLKWHEYVSDEKLVELYSECDSLVAASYAEGFGLPIVEAGQYGKPVIASDIDVFREVSEGASGASFFEVGNSDALADAVKSFIKSKSKVTKGEVKPWPTWKQSAEQIENVLVNQDWYYHYKPKAGAGFIDRGSIGKSKMTGPLSKADTKHKIEVIEPPFRESASEDIRINVKLTNLSDVPWSSEGNERGEFKVGLGYHALNARGDMLVYDNPRTRIPFVIVPGESIYLPIQVPVSQLEQGVAQIQIEMVQEAVNWWGVAETISLDVEKLLAENA